MKKYVILISLLMIIPVSNADWFYNSESIITSIRMGSDAELIPIKPGGYAESVTINLTFFPKEFDYNEILAFHSNPKAELDGDNLQFVFKNPKGKVEFELIADIKTTNYLKEVKDKVDFPITDVPDEVKIYLDSSKTIDSENKDIVKLASDLVKGEDDLYFAVIKLADWTKNNIDYNLSTLTAEVSQKASWVLENRQGVCDELTSLFIAMARAVGIPARFVSGISYTSSDLFPENWGPHGWAEVYFPKVGWVPFDVTYGEFGWVDPTHIKFKDSFDSDEPSTYYQWLGKNVDLKTKDMAIKTDLIEKTGRISNPIEITASLYKSAASFGSYNLVEADIENLGDYYYATELYLVKPKEIKIVGDEFKSVLLKPEEKKKIFWILRVDNELNEKYSYTFPVIVSSVKNITSQTFFAASALEQYVSLDSVEKYASLIEEEREKKYSTNVLINCELSKKEIYEYEHLEIHCSAKNTGNIFLEDVDVCFFEKCYKTDLGISQAKNFTFKAENLEQGLRSYPVVVSNSIVTKSNFIDYIVKDSPLMSVQELEYPKEVSYKDDYEVIFVLTKNSSSNAKNVDIKFIQNDVEKNWKMQDFTEDKRFVINVEAAQLKYRLNKYSIVVNYEDDNGKEYHLSEDFFIDLNDASVMQRVGLFFNGLNSLKAFFVLLIFSSIFLTIIILIFRKKKPRFDNY